ncbi:response regulator [Spirochaeta cellobiosiphila]|uniref:response regulator n=1 Tax=Spirochaeta cellobiosiphila TaxID=504483 RepID=UPI000409FF38|nr:response regulator [Spirochaeta cellobiosiphila]
MYKILLVDDEIVIREGIRNNIDWQSTDFTLVGEASDGETALPLLEDLKPDILLTDIRMPFLDGLSLARMVKSNHPSIKIIILSGHDEFQYAKEAIAIGVEDYLLKPFSSTELLQTLNQVAQQIQTEIEQQNDIKSLRQQIIQTTIIRREEWLNDLVAGLIPFTNAVEQSKEMGIDLIAKKYVITIIDLNAQEGYSQELIQTRLMLKKVLRDLQDTIIFSQGAERQILLIKQRTSIDIRDRLEVILNEIQQKVGKNSHCQLIIGRGTPVDRITELPLSYEGALRNLGDDQLIPHSDREVLSLIPIKAAKLGDKLPYIQGKDVDELIKGYKEFLESIPGHSSFICNYLLGSLLVTASEMIVDMGDNPEEIIPGYLQKERQQSIVQSKDQFCHHIQELILTITRYRDSHDKHKHYSLVQRAKRFIDGQYTDTNLSLHMVAEFVKVSPNHFSTVFAQEMGVTFIEYVTNMRIDRAKYLLLTTDKRSSDIGYEVGFSDPHYFSFIFKKTTSISPREFRSEKNTTLT